MMSVDNWTRKAGMQDGTSLTLCCSSDVLLQDHLQVGMQVSQAMNILGHPFARLARLGVR